MCIRDRFIIVYETADEIIFPLGDLIQIFCNVINNEFMHKPVIFNKHTYYVTNVQENMIIALSTEERGIILLSSKFQYGNYMVLAFAKKFNTKKYSLIRKAQDLVTIASTISVKERTQKDFTFVRTSQIFNNAYSS
eukprot:TRINITY_DN1952_c0_g1_i2.p2 TRINITY_DN1952_c0_g1~~TRINITY_DN1952_c0_g1_i2.p2  ORF type:complete len:156 (-),score=35.84 TRINITY_DN1952_c0_g1_i2:899-1306(-)